jgi:hypothetical protein
VERCLASSSASLRRDQCEAVVREAMLQSRSPYLPRPSIVRIQGVDCDPIFPALHVPIWVPLKATRQSTATTTAIGYDIALLTTASLPVAP